VKDGNNALGFLTNTRSCGILVELLGEPSYARELDGVFDSDYGYIQRVLQKFEEYGLVESEIDSEDGRKRMYELTERGRDAAELLDQLESVLDGGENLE
jgi:DNA-binding MarR family transcriptional regulator